jgi:hypothetical protein
VITKVPEEINNQNLLKHVQDLNRETDGINDLKEIGDCRKLRKISDLTAEGTIHAGSSENNRPESFLALIVPDVKVILTVSQKPARPPVGYT